MHKSKLFTFFFINSVFSLIYFPAMATVVKIIEPTIVVGSWSNAFSGVAGSLATTDLTGQGGNLESAVPAGSGALKLETTASGDSRAEVRLERNGGFGTVSDLLSSGSVSYNYYQESGGPSATITPAFKFEVFDFTNISGDGFATFVFEPVYNGGVGAFDTWHNVTIDFATANFWVPGNGLYGVSGKMLDQNNQEQFIYTNTLSDWLALYDDVVLDTFLDAFIGSISFGIGSGTPSQTGYVDDVNFSSNFAALDEQITINADFESDVQVSAVPLPAALPLYATGLGLMGFLGWRKRRKKVSA